MEINKSNKSSCGRTRLSFTLDSKERTTMQRFFGPVAITLIAVSVLVAQTPPTPDAAETNKAVQEIIRAISPDSIRIYDNTLASFGTRHTMSDTNSATRGIGAARRWISAKFSSFAKSDPDFKVYEDRFTLEGVPRISKPTELVNVYGLLRGKEGPEGRYIVISGHYDSRCTDIMNYTSDAPGADDDGSGSSLVLEAARAFTSTRFRPDANIIFICFAGEEQGLYGSEHFAMEARKKSLNIIADLNNDIVGSIRGGNGEVISNMVRVFSQGYQEMKLGSRDINPDVIGYVSDSPSRELARYIHAAGDEFLPNFRTSLIFRQDRFLRGGDHASFNKYGYAAVRFTEPNEDYRHQHQDVRVENDKVDGRNVKVLYGDLPQFVDSSYVARVCRINSLTAALLSISPPAPANAVMLVDKLEYGTRFRWDNPLHGVGIAGWKIYYRKSAQPEWQGCVFVNGSENPTLEYDLATMSKDDYIFGIATVGKNGAESITVAPPPGK